MGKLRIQIQELNAIIVDRDKTAQNTHQQIYEQELEISSLKNKLKEFESLSDNLAMLEETRVQVINLQTENQKLEILANQSSDLMSELTQIKEQKESLSTEFSILKSSVFESERKEITSKNPKFDSKNFKVLEEIQNLIIEGMTLCKTLDTSAKEVLMVYNEKLKKAYEIGRAHV